MAHFNADAARRKIPVVHREPITFVLAGEQFTVLPTPTFGDVLDLAEAPEITPDTEQEATLALAHFIELMVPVEDRLRYRQALRRVMATEAPAIVELGVWITEQVTANPTTPPANLPRTRRTNGGRSKPKSGGDTHLN